MSVLSGIPDLEFAWPDCSICGENGEMDYDGDHWWCETCDNRWASNGTDGRPRWGAPS